MSHEFYKVIFEKKTSKLDEKIKVKVYENQEKSVLHIQTPSRSSFPLCFLRELSTQICINDSVLASVRLAVLGSLASNATAGWCLEKQEGSLGEQTRDDQ